MQPSPPKTTSILPEPPAPTKAKHGAHGRLIALCLAASVLVAGVVTIAIVFTTSSGKKDNRSDSPGVAGAYAAAFASSRAAVMLAGMVEKLSR